MIEEMENQVQQQFPGPSSSLQRLEKLVGVWNISGGAGGKITYEWMDGGYFLVQRVYLEQDGMIIKGVEIIGHERKFGEGPSEQIKSRFYDNLGDTFDYVYELDSDTLTIWAGEKGSPTFYRGTFSDNGDVLIGRWVYPDGGGYASKAVRVRR